MTVEWDAFTRRHLQAEVDIGHEALPELDVLQIAAAASKALAATVNVTQVEPFPEDFCDCPCDGCRIHHHPVVEGPVVLKASAYMLAADVQSGETDLRAAVFAALPQHAQRRASRPVVNVGTGGVL